MYDHGSLACGRCFVVILVSVIVVLPEVFKGTLVDALALGAEEGRCSLR